VANTLYQTNGRYSPWPLDLTPVDGAVIYDVRDMSTFTLQAVANGAVTVGSLVIKVQVSNDGANPNDFPSGSITRSTAGISTQLDVVAYNYVHVIVTTAGTSGTFMLHAVASKTVT
jgi:hypothetical protein